MKIGIFTDSYLPYTSGVVRSIQTFSEELTSNGHEVFIFAPSYRDCRKENRVFRFSSIPSPTNRDFTLAMPFSIRLRPTIKKLNLDLIHVHSPFLLGRLGARYARRLGIPLVFTFHTLYDQYVHYVPFAQSLTKDLAQRISRGFCNHCDLVIVPTAAVEKYLHEIGVKASIRVVPTGIKVMNYQSGDRDWLRCRFGLPEGEKVLLFVGRLGQEKNINFLMECFARINREMKNTRLVLVGGGPEEEELKNKAKELGIAGQVTFTGVLPPSDVVNCYAGADIFVFSSVTETQGIVIGEAKAAGLPVVAVAAFGVSEMVDDGIDGFLTELEPLQFIEKITLLLKNDDLYEKMSRNARNNAENLSTANCTAKLINCYSHVIERRACEV
ncbi:MAG: Alpha-monoglucosyldiacylglycerol synthase [Pelotomaculum sp. PtaB.Bin013]|uniref:Glycosyltransferase family 4 protein n=1 Tax=Pelotomaculum isophthalicicum JI TaxID=947010 RepID=A0A9X4H4D6_9FIRM|nr:glycosyltransferase family 4 protein [Pelotomaculum isophthalicicum]MDF9408673.1 glycosyltransferase family 4 protein [Pelotomaculum isophthalicicum JI]OPX83257.1 MAG: Alpha-monoglucosyldiacylglycerol synthase [Pelotomaculum sp. PtaB.Bin013]